MRRFNILNSNSAFSFLVIHSLEESIPVLSPLFRGQEVLFLYKKLVQ